ncbi:uncharacterized protein LOC123539279 [Mercenaria mercenaria]|uniref:uncharacterized protein LOC123539279 n=1 Tax=Mercenaria mercenaria TaxID=6596 RepID=UPI00234E9E05|nr:uncharacterized protein LOC123539279 [Mercenaria mercenaria]XP_053386236.1 uncharacterized protein LOC123539279 [Mercenaria mercenaria]
MIADCLNTKIPKPRSRVDKTEENNRRECELTTESSDSEDEIVTLTVKHGDAHISETYDKETSVRELGSHSEDKDTEHKDVTVRGFDTEAENAEVEVETEVIDVLDERTEVETHYDDHSSEENKRSENEVEDTAIKEMHKEVPNKNQEVEITGAEASRTHKVKKDKPPIKPRKSDRKNINKMPSYLQDYVCKSTSIDNRPLDLKLDALTKFLESGLLNTVTSDVAHRIVEAIIK